MSGVLMDDIYQRSGIMTSYTMNESFLDIVDQLCMCL